jgi:hypothetical protein
MVITNTPKKLPQKAERKLDPINSSTRSHQDEGNNEIIDSIDSASDYLSDQLNFFQSTQIKTKIMKYIKFTSYQGNCGFNEIRARVRLIQRHLRTTLKF